MTVRERKSLVFFVCLIFIIVASATTSQAKKHFIFIPKVDIYKVKKAKKIEVVLTYPARLKSFKDVLIRAQVSGVLLKRYFKEGSHIKKGDALFLIDPSIYKAKLEQLKSDLAAALAKLKYSKANYLRVEKSFKEHLISKDKRDRALFQYESSAAEVRSLKAQVEQAKIYLSYTKPKAPISGFARIRKVDIGNLIDVGEPLVEIVKINPIYAEFAIPDSDIPLVLSNVEHLKPVLILGQSEFYGKIDFIDKKINPNTQTLKIRAVFRNRKYKLFPNEFVKIKLLGVFKRNELLIPQRAVLQTVNGPIVFVIENSKAKPRQIKIIGQFKQYFSVKGLKKGETIAVDNLLKLKPNTTVKIDKTIK